MTAVTTHVLDTAAGRPAPGVPVSLQARRQDGSWEQIATAVTNRDGRTPSLACDGEAKAGVHRLVFATTDYLDDDFFDEVVVTFRVSGEEALHVPLLFSPYGYSVYRGS